MGAKTVVRPQCLRTYIGTYLAGDLHDGHGEGHL